MVQEARTWMKMNQINCETDSDYFMLTASVSAAFLVSAEELDFRQMLKNRENYDNMVHLNNTLDGNLGKVGILKQPRVGDFGRSLLPSMTMPSKSINI